jgi:hypothetical protein
MDKKKSQCIEEAKRLTSLMEHRRPFSFLRLGDGEVNWMLRLNGINTPYNTRYKYKDERIASSIDAAYSVTGLEEKYFTRLCDAFSGCTYLDYYDAVNKDNIYKLPFIRSPNQLKNPPNASQIFYEWGHYEMHDYISGRNVLFAGAEAPLMSALYNDVRYRQLSKEYFPSQGDVYFASIRDHGRRYSENLELIKNDLRIEIRKNNIDTLFLSLASAAKIICYELAEEENICTYDLGSFSRALTYSGSPGYHSFRSFHNPYLFRVPLNIYMDALEKSYPEYKLIDLLAKAQAQMLFDLQYKTVGSSTATSTGLDLSAVNLGFFFESYSEYRSRFGMQIKYDKEAKKLDKQFEMWKTRNGIGFKGRIFKSLIDAKKVFKKAANKK